MGNEKETATTTSFGGNVWGSRYPNRTSAYSCSKLRLHAETTTLFRLRGLGSSLGFRDQGVGVRV